MLSFVCVSFVYFSQYDLNIHCYLQWYYSCVDFYIRSIDSITWSCTMHHVSKVGYYERSVESTLQLDATSNRLFMVTCHLLCFKMYISTYLRHSPVTPISFCGTQTFNFDIAYTIRYLVSFTPLTISNPLEIYRSWYQSLALLRAMTRWSRKILASWHASSISSWVTSDVGLVAPNRMLEGMLLEWCLAFESQ